MTRVLRPGGTADVPVMLDVMAAAFDPRFGEGWSGAQLLGTLALPDSWARLVFVETRVAGFSLCRRVGPEAELLLIGVIPDQRGAGIGMALLETAVADAHDRRVTTMFLEVRDGNIAAQQLYRRGGFISIGRRRDYYRGDASERFDAVTMRRDLRAAEI